MARGSGANEGGWSPLVVAGLPVVVVGIGVLGCIGVCTGFPCMTTGIRYGIWPDRCPASDLRLDVDASATGLLRGQEGGLVRIVPRARWLDGGGRDATPISSVLRRGFSWDLHLVDAAGKDVPGLDLGRRRGSGDGIAVPVELPAVPDGDYTLKVDVSTGFEATTVEVPLPVYAPAILHVMTDRPLYKPGQEVLLRSVALRRTDLTPIEGRPGRWRIVDPDGVELLVEKDQAGPWGVADGSFPLDRDAKIGRWTAQWLSGDASDQVTFDVRPFRLPRLQVDANPSKPWVTAGDELVIEGRAHYTSGAPVANAPVGVALSVGEGRWTLPLEWEARRPGVTGPDGRFRVSYGWVPADLIDRTTLVAHVSVVDPTGEAVEGQTSVPVSRDSLEVEVLTELGGGLVEGFNNRTYLRASSPAGTPLAGIDLVVKRPYDPTDPGKTATTDVDGVASLQLDPGAPVSVVVPAPPFRARPPVADPPSLSSGRQMGRDPSLSLEDRRSLDGALAPLGACRTFAVGDEDVPVGVAVDPTGLVRKVTAADDPLSGCVANVMRAMHLAPGDARTLSLAWRIPDAKLPSLQWRTQNAFGSAPVEPVLAKAALKARTCFTAGQGVDGSEVITVHWSVDHDAKPIAVALQEMPGHGLSPAAMTCVRTALVGLALPDEASGPAMGVSIATLVVPRPVGSAPEQATTRTGYELAVEASDHGKALGNGRVVVDVGTVPPFRLRADPSLVHPGDEVTVEMLRGPGFSGDLPQELALYAGTVEVARAAVEANKVKWKIPATIGADGPPLRGFLHAEWNGARTVIFVQDPAPLSVALSTDQPTYRPGDTAHLTVTTRAGETPTAAAVGLVGVDAALSQLAKLTGPDDFGRVTVRATATTPAFGAFDPRALTLGQIRGENAAKAAVLAIDTLPMDPAGDSPAAGSASVVADVDGPTSRNFYRALERATTKVRGWEGSAPSGALLKPEEMVGFWDTSLDELAHDGDPAVDGYGRELRLDVLPLALVALTDPRTLVVDAARLPEDFVGWTQYVTQEVR